MSIILHFIITLLILVCKSNCYQLTYVCPSQNITLIKLAEFRYQSLCSGKVKCDNIKTIFRGLYTPLALTIGNREWSVVSNLTDKLSLCGIENIVINDIKNSALNLSKICRIDRNVVVFNFNDEIGDLIESDSEDKDCFIKSDLNHEVFNSVLTTCPNILWVSGKNSCSNNNSNTIGLRMHNIGWTNVTIPYGAEEKQMLYHKDLIVTSLVYPPFLNKETFENGTVKYSGIVMEMMNKLSNNLQFKFIMIEPADGAAGIQLPNGSWNGLIRQLIDKEADIVAAPLTISALRDTVVDFSSTFYYESMGIMIRLPDKQQNLWRMFTLFSKQIWLLILLVSIISTFVLYALHKLSPIPLDSEFESFGNCTWYVFSCMSNQGGEYDPVSWSAQNFLTFFWLFVFAFISMYSGGLIATLTTSSFSLPFKNLNELAQAVKRNEFKICLQGNTGFHQTILKKDLGEYEILANWLHENHGYDGTEENCLQKLLKSNKLAFIGEMTRLQEIQKQHCLDNPLVILSDSFYPGYFAFALQKKSPLNSLISMEITDALQFGLMNKWKEIWETKLKFCRIVGPNDVIRADMDPLSLFEIGGPFLLFVIGLISSLMAFVAEVIRYKLRKHSNVINCKRIKRDLSEKQESERKDTYILNNNLTRENNLNDDYCA